MSRSKVISDSLGALTIASLLAVYLIWGSTYVAIRYTLDSVPPFLLAGGRFLVAGALLLGFLVVRRTPWPSACEWRDGAIVGILLLTIGNGGLVLSETLVPTGLAAMFFAATPLAATLWAGALGQWPRPWQWFGVLLGLAGVAILVAGTQLKTDTRAALYLTIAVASWTLGSVLAQRRLRPAAGAMGFATEMIAGGAVLMILSVAAGEHLSGPISPHAAIAWMYLVLAGSLLGFSAYMYLLENVTPALAMSYGYVNPVVALFLGALMRGETLSPRELVASAIIVVSVLLLTVRRRIPLAKQ